jgi:NitT/TauT family transport system ATP-binding protein
VPRYRKEPSPIGTIRAYRRRPLAATEVRPPIDWARGDVSPDNKGYEKAFPLAIRQPRDRDAPLNPPRHSGAPVVRLRGIAKRFAGGVAALDRIDLDIRRSEFVSVLGPSGCGKTTLLRIIAGLSRPSAGERHLALAPGDRGFPAAGRIGFVFQDPTLMPWTTVNGNVLLPFRLIGRVGPAERERAAAEIRAVGLAGFERAYPRQLSGGMRMRVSIARALVTDPDLLLLDEPFAALDEITRMGLNDDLLWLWQSRRATVVFVTHSVFEAVYLSTRIAVMTSRPGRIAADCEVPLPQPRERALRLSPDYAAVCAEISVCLAEAMAGVGR